MLCTSGNIFYDRNYENKFSTDFGNNTDLKQQILAKKAYKEVCFVIILDFQKFPKNIILSALECVEVTFGNIAFGTSH